MRPARRVVITGFMGAGKTTVARELARLLGCSFVDLDELIDAREGRTPRELIDEEGETAFREIETRALRDALRDESARVVALGGGAWTLERNRALIAGHDCLTVWLDASFELCWERVGIPVGDTCERPLARERERTRSLYELRRPLYGLADARVEVGAGDDARAVAERVLTLARDCGELRKEKR